MTGPAHHYPGMPPKIGDESPTEYTNRLLGAYGKTHPYDHERNRQCSIGYHDQCSDPHGERCECPCHRDVQQRWNWPRRFQLHRDTDITGASGTGLVADGTIWPDGTVSIRWRGDRPSVVFWEELSHAYAVHGHGGHTRFVWLDDEQGHELPEGNEADPR